MSLEIVFDNLGALADDLRRLPRAVQDEGSVLVHQAARAFAGAMGSSFPQESRTGDTRAATEIEIVNVLKAVVRNTAQAAAPLEGGFLHATAGRWIDGQNIWVPQAMRARADMIGQLRQIVERGRGLHLRALEVSP